MVRNRWSYLCRDVQSPPLFNDKHGLLTGLRRDACCDHENISAFREGLLETMSQPDLDRAVRFEIFSRQLNQFIGLGEGLTPSGDDFLVGLLWALWVGEADRLPGFETFLYAVQSTLHKTNDISAQMLRFAIRKRFTEPLISLARVSDPTDCAEAFKRIAAFGHTSGFDTLCGLLVGLKTTERIAFLSQISSNCFESRLKKNLYRLERSLNRYF